MLVKTSDFCKGKTLIRYSLRRPTPYSEDPFHRGVATLMLRNMRTDKDDSYNSQ